MTSKEATRQFNGTYQQIIKDGVCEWRHTLKNMDQPKSKMTIRSVLNYYQEQRRRNITLKIGGHNVANVEDLDRRVEAAVKLSDLPQGVAEVVGKLCSNKAATKSSNSDRLPESPSGGKGRADAKRVKQERVDKFSLNTVSSSWNINSEMATREPFAQTENVNQRKSRPINKDDAVRIKKEMIDCTNDIDWGSPDKLVDKNVAIRIKKETIGSVPVEDQSTPDEMNIGVQIPNSTRVNIANSSLDVSKNTITLKQNKLEALKVKAEVIATMVDIIDISSEPTENNTVGHVPLTGRIIPTVPIQAQKSKEQACANQTERRGTPGMFRYSGVFPQNNSTSCVDDRSFFSSGIRSSDNSTYSTPIATHANGKWNSSSNAYGSDHIPGNFRNAAASSPRNSSSSVHSSERTEIGNFRNTGVSSNNKQSVGKEVTESNRAKKVESPNSNDASTLLKQYEAIIKEEERMKDEVRNSEKRHEENMKVLQTWIDKCEESSENHKKLLRKQTELKKRKQQMKETLEKRVASNNDTPRVASNYEPPRVASNYEPPRVASSYELPRVASNYDTPRVASNKQTQSKEKSYLFFKKKGCRSQNSNSKNYKRPTSKATMKRKTGTRQY